MGVAKVAISIEDKLLKKVDFYVKKGIFKSRSQAIQLAMNDAISHLEHRRLANECAKLDINEEQQFADFGLNEDLNEWPRY
ncbi:MAG: CopG family transcriptional regulator [Gammaproteobacteria bacterium]|nr:CopG family transcriptional regulator [Gammaproteobacteria bacterium]